MPAAGELACLASALLWASAVVVFRTAIARHGAGVVNTLKGVLATAALAATVAGLGSWSDLGTGRPADLMFLALSGLAGITIGDTALFAAVTRIGVHRSMLLQTTAPLFTAAIAAFLGERLSSQQIIGSLVVLVGVAAVVRPQGQAPPVRASMAAVGLGLFLGTISALGQGSGVVLAKEGLARIPVLHATLVRLAAASAGLLLVTAARGNLPELARALGRRATVARVVPATFVGTYVAMFLLMLGVRLAPASVAAVLLATTPVFTLVLESWVEKRTPTLSEVLGTTLTVAGVALLTTAR